MSPKKWSKNTFGWARAEVLGALVNAVFLVALCFSILVESLKRCSSSTKSRILITRNFICYRFVEIETIHDPQLILIVGGIGLLINVIGLFLFHGNISFLQVTSCDCSLTRLICVLDHGHGHSHGGGHGHSHGAGHGHSHGAGHRHSHGEKHEDNHRSSSSAHNSLHSHSHMSQLASMDNNDNDAICLSSQVNLLFPSPPLSNF